MLIYWAERLSAVWPSLADRLALHWPGTRACVALAATLVVSLISGPRLIAWLRRRFTEPVKTASPELAILHASKQGTPTMGGLLVVGGVWLAMLVCGDWSNPLVPIAMLLMSALAALGACDDLVKLRTARRGLSARAKLVAQGAIALVVAWLVYRWHVGAGNSLDLALPLVGAVHLGWLFVPLATLVMVGSSNAVNLADGLDGLAGGCLVCAYGALAVVAYLVGSETWAAYLGTAYVGAAHEVIVLAAALVGGLLAFLRFNRHPASVFLGDAGSLPLGGMLGLLAVVCRQELLFVVIGGVFVAEAASVIVQVLSYRWTGRRVFRCAPLHHHFEFRGWAEQQIVVRFWVAGGLCAILGVAGLTMTAGQTVPAAHPARPSATTLHNQEPPFLAELF